MIIGVNGLSADTGAMVARSQRVVVVTDHSKLGRTAISQMVPVGAIGTLVTDAAGPSAALDALRLAGVQVLEV